MVPMRVVLAPDRFGGLSGVEAARAVRDGWIERAPHVSPVLVPQSDGGPGFLTAVEAATDATLELVPLSDRRSVAVLMTSTEPRTAYVEAAEVVGGASTSEPLGALLDRLVAGGVRRTVIGVGGLRILDGGRGLVAALGDDPAAAAARLEPLQIVVAADTDRVLLGLQGACASGVDELGLSQEEAQEAERQMGEWVDVVRRAVPPPTDLLTGAARRLERLPGVGAGGGLGFALAALGASLRSGPELMAEVSGLAEAVRGAAVVVTATTTYDWRVLQASVAEQVSRAAASCAAPAILLADEIQVGRRETMSLGFAGSYGVLPSGRMRLPTNRPSASDDEVALRALAARVAGTWTPRRT